MQHGRLLVDCNSHSLSEIRAAMSGWQGANEETNLAFVTEEQRRQAGIPAEDRFTNLSRAEQN